MADLGLALIEANGGGSEDVIQSALSAVRRHLGMEVAYFSEFVGDRTYFRHVDAPGLEHLIKVGDSQALDDVYCNHILEGRLPELIPDTAHEPLALSLPITAATPIGSHASIAVRRPDGTPYGMFCCLSPKPNPTLNDRDLETMRVFAELATRKLHEEMETNRRTHDKRAAVEASIAQSHFHMLYQPILELRSMTMVSLEALCRFHAQPYRSPDLWFADAQSVGLHVELELAAIEAALRGFDAIPDHCTLSVNASPACVLSGAILERIAPRHRRRTVLEITEHARIDDYGAIHASLAPLRAAGVAIAIDDAGAGYSGLQHLVHMAPDIIKMDMSLTRGIDVDRARRALASAMVYYAHETGAQVVAEGIETPAELETLHALGIGRGQGYLIGRPAPAGQWLASPAASEVMPQAR